MNIDYLKFAGVLSFVASIMHLGIIIGGPSWYRFFGAGEQMALMAEQGLVQPTLITAAISAVLAIWGAYAWSGAGVFPHLPLLKTALVLITLVYLLRGIAGFFIPFLSNHPAIMQNSLAFWLWSSAICLGVGVIHLKGIIDRWSFWQTQF